MKSETTVDDWVRMYREGTSGAGITSMLPAVDPLAVLTALAAAKVSDPTLEAEHALNRPGREAEDTSAERQLKASWRARPDELKAFIKANGRLPRQHGGDVQESIIGRWLHGQRDKVSKGTLLPQQRAALDAVGNWDSDRRDKREGSRFPGRLRALAAFKAKHGRWPSYRNRMDPEELALGLWLRAARQAAFEGRLTEVARKALDRGAPGWNPWQGR